MTDMASYGRTTPAEDAAIAEIVHGILTVQARLAAKQKRPLGRGTHTKGICVRGTFEVFDLPSTIGDAGLASRLARGLFARPGVYPATIRFANGASQINPDRKPDVRALSFSIELPPGAVDGAARLDFTMNDAPTFPINDARAFAALMKVASADGPINVAKALWSLSFPDLAGFGRTILAGRKQQRGLRKPYQQTRFWSTVPFLHGSDEVIKYSAIPAAINEGRPLGVSPNALNDELQRHLSEDSEAGSFDFALQVLDERRLTWQGKTRDGSFWIENASVEWNEAEAPYHIVGRLRLLAHSVLTADECAGLYIDVTEHSIPASRPIGSINRARWAAESASRRTRLSAAADTGTVPSVASSRSLRRRLGDLSLRTVVRGVVALLILALLVGALSFATMVYLDRGGGMLPDEPFDTVEYPDQGWGAGVEAPDRQAYYYTPQGASLKNMRYSWFVHLEMPWGTRRLADPDVLRRYGFIVDRPTAANPAQLPVGFAKHFDRQLNEEVLDITCAACHTGQLNVTRNGRRTAVRIDGGPALHAFTDADFGHFVPTMVSAMASTAANPMKFSRFARKILGEQYPDGRWELHRQLRGVIRTFAGVAWTEKTRGLYPTQEGYGRTDALARISNTVFGDNLDSQNYAVGNAPVSFPPVWNIWKFDWVQYNASVSQPMARNIGEAMGVGSRYTLVDRYGKPLPAEQRFRSTTLVENLHRIELTLRKLRPPVWPGQLLGGIDAEKAARGKELFNTHCVSCHGPHIAPPALKATYAPLKTATDPEWIVRTVCVEDVGTDPNTAVNFSRAMVDITRTGMTAEDLRRVASRGLEAQKVRQAAYLTGEIARLQAAPGPVGTAGGTSYGATPVDQIAALRQELASLDANIEKQLAQLDPKRLPVGLALSYLGTMIRENAYADRGYTQAQRDEYDGFGILDLPQVVSAYKPRPLAGAWATAPFLHNGSVPTIYDLLSPAEQRPKRFQVGSREFDPLRVGVAASSGFWEFDTSQAGNSNRGHEFNAGYNKGAGPRNGVIGPLLSHEERLAIIEHLKIRNDDVDGPQEPNGPPSAGCSPAPGYRPAAKAGM
ncbi:MAG: c-type cytochrome [Acidobacteria bacterium]|nr:c-type cytochrome [Acidobacteriota bacterium]